MRWALAPLWFACVGLACAGGAHATTVHIVAAGNNTGIAGELPLRYAESDATSLAKIMYRLGGVASHDASLLLGERAATLRKALVKTNARIRSAKRRAGEDSVLIVYYSGHADAVGLHMDGTTLPFDEIRDLVAGSPAQVRVLIIDACRSGSLTRVKGIKRPAKPFAITVDNRLAVEGIAIITSSAAGEDSHESDRLRASFFTHHLISGLRGVADRNRDGTVTLDEAYGYAYGQTLRSSSGSGLQHPTYEYEIKGRGGLPLTRLARDRGRSGRIALSDPGLYLVFEGSEDGPVIAEASVGKRGASVLVPPGEYVVQRRAPRAYREYSFELRRGQTIRLSKLPYKTQAYARLLRKGGGDQRVVHGLYLGTAGRGEVLPGVGPTPQLVLGYSADLQWLTLGVRLRYAVGSATTDIGGVSFQSHELGAGFVLERFVDLRYLSLVFGAAIEGVLHYQTFESRGVAPDRSAWGVGITVLFGIERELGSGLGLRLEAGPRTEIYERVTTEAGAPTGSELASAVTWWVGGGVAWRF